jgi:superfamily II DNA or RNA helicase
MKEEFFKDVLCVFGDECHLFKAKSLTTLMNKMKGCEFRIGTTGTLDGTHVHKLVVEGLFGPVFRVTTTKDLIDQNFLSNIKINCILLKYPESKVEEIKRAKYIDEIQWLVANEERNYFIEQLCKNLTGNTLVLFNFVEKHGIPMYKRLKQYSEYPCYLIHGKTQADDRESIRQIVNKQSRSILVASYGTCSTGINIKNIHNIVFTSPSKSVVRVLQSIGRGLRKSEKKDKVSIYDIGDDLRWKKHRNHSLRHMDERINLYSNERFPYEVVNINLKETS